MWYVFGELGGEAKGGRPVVYQCRQRLFRFGRSAIVHCLLSSRTDDFIKHKLDFGGIYLQQNWCSPHSSLKSERS